MSKQGISLSLATVQVEKKKKFQHLNLVQPVMYQIKQPTEHLVSDLHPIVHNKLANNKNCYLVLIHQGSGGRI